MSRNKQRKEASDMDEDHGNNSGSSSGNLDTAKADRSVWLMKCPLVVARSWQSHAASSSDSPPVAKVVLSLDPLLPDDKSPPQVPLFLPISPATLNFSLIPHPILSALIINTLFVRFC